MIRFIYNLLWPIGLLFFLPGYLVKMFRRGGYREKFGQRFAIYDVDLRAQLANRKSIWIHAVSVGEVAIALKLIQAIRELDASAQFVLTTTTTTGFAFANRSAAASTQVLYAPLDFWPIMRRAFAVIRPAKIVLVEAEVWPNLVAEAHTRQIPIALVNARLSPRSEKRFRRFQSLIAPTFRLLDLVSVPEFADVARWNALGVEEARIQPIGSIKYDPEIAHVDSTTAEAVLRELNIDNRRSILLGGSTHPGEEEVLARIFCDLRAEFADFFLILAPRHAERAGEVGRTLERLGLRVALRSKISSNRPVDCLLLDSTGELRNWYAVATVVFIGKSLRAHGGQNPAEAIAAGKPALFGPHMENFATFARALIEQHGAVQIGSAAELQRAIVDLLRDHETRNQMVANARNLLSRHAGATTRTARLLVDLA
jgi:3-deoxy-D-manno-octulosonic-acid transferase